MLNVLLFFFSLSLFKNLIAAAGNLIQGKGKFIKI